MANCILTMTTKPVDGVIGTETMSQMHYIRQAGCRGIPVSEKEQTGSEKWKYAKQCTCAVDSIAYSAMIDAFTDKFDAPLRSGNYVAVIPLELKADGGKRMFKVTFGHAH